jgi:Holliday junction resolvase RusA-like endonuclease
VTLDPTPSVAELLRMKQERMARRKDGHSIVPILEQRAAPLPTWPVKLWIPWSHLISENRKYSACVVQTGEGPKARLLLTPEYRDALAAIRGQVTLQLGLDVGPFEPVAIPLRFEGAVWVPDERRRDVPNLAKCTHDAMEGLVYQNDEWLHDTRWYRAGVNVDKPGADITITPLEPQR